MSVDITDIRTIVDTQDQWRSRTINLIASENAQSPAVRTIQNCDFMARYAEGHPNRGDEVRRYYQGTRYIDRIETMAREELDVCIVIFANRKYQILQVELARVGAQTMSPKTLEMLDLSNPDLDFVKMAEGMGVTAARATTADEFNDLLGRFMNERGPRLIEALLP